MFCQPWLDHDRNHAELASDFAFIKQKHYDMALCHRQFDEHRRRQGQISMNIHFSASEHDEAKSRLKQLTDRYGQTNLQDATHIVALAVMGICYMCCRTPCRLRCPFLG